MGAGGLVGSEGLERRKEGGGASDDAAGFNGFYEIYFFVGGVVWVGGFGAVGGVCGVGVVG